MKKSALPLFALLAFFTIVFPKTDLFAAPGTLDPAFNSNGIVGFPFPCSSGGPERRVSLALTSPEPVNKIVVGGTAICSSNNIIVARNNADGSPDTTFGSDGIVDSDVLARLYGADFRFVKESHVAVQPDGKIVVGGNFWVGDFDPLDTSYSGLRPYLARYNSDGSLDRDFGTDGLVVPSLTLGFVNSLALQSGGQIIACGSPPDRRSSIIVRFNSNGSQDTGFGGGSGQVAASCPYLSDFAIQSDGKILARSNDASDRLILIRLFPDGTPDTSFHTDTSVISLGSNAARGIVPQADGKIIVGDYRAISRLNSDGSLDTSFGSGGSLSSRDRTAALTYIAVTKRDKVLATFINAVDPGRFTMARFTPNGSPDTTFNGTGYVTSEISVAGRRDPTPAAVYSHGVVVQNDDKIVVGGVSRVNTDGSAQESFATLVRYEGDTSLSYYPPTIPVMPLRRYYELPADQRSLLTPTRPLPSKYTPLFLRKR